MVNGNGSGGDVDVVILLLLGDLLGVLGILRLSVPIP